MINTQQHIYTFINLKPSVNQCFDFYPINHFIAVDVNQTSVV